MSGAASSVSRRFGQRALGAAIAVAATALPGAIAQAGAHRPHPRLVSSPLTAYPRRRTPSSSAAQRSEITDGRGPGRHAARVQRPQLLLRQSRQNAPCRPRCVRRQQHPILAAHLQGRRPRPRPRTGPRCPVTPSGAPSPPTDSAERLQMRVGRGDQIGRGYRRVPDRPQRGPEPVDPARVLGREAVKDQHRQHPVGGGPGHPEMIGDVRRPGPRRAPAGT